jgi:hypothetical protein
MAFQPTQLGRDRDGDIVWEIAPGVVVGGPYLSQKDAEIYVQMLSDGYGIGYQLDDYRRLHGPIERSIT